MHACPKFHVQACWHEIIANSFALAWVDSNIEHMCRLVFGVQLTGACFIRVCDIDVKPDDARV